MNAMRVVYTPEHLAHDPEHEFAHTEIVPGYEIPSRAEAIRETLEADDAFSFESPTRHGTAPIEAVHDPGLLRFLENAWEGWRTEAKAREAMPDTVIHPAMIEGMRPGVEPISPLGRLGFWCFDTATPLVEGSYSAARWAVDVALTAADLVLGGEETAYGLCRPPGHHAPRAAFGGYCLFNNAAIATQYIASATDERVAILDVDYHHGNGTQQIFYRRGDVFYVSLHGDPTRAYPYYTGYAEETGAGAGEGANLNLPLPVACSDEEYLRAVDRAVEAISAFGSSILVVSLGLDTYRDDPICDLALTTRAYHEVGSRARALGHRVVVLQEGGYFVPRLGENVRQWLRGLEGLQPQMSEV
jgi:acetoin utilization deacetylase AcuC-like enzyme